MELPSNLINEIKAGRVILFLGAGASMGATDDSGNGMFGVEGLKNELSERFLNGEDKQSSLSSIAELAISESDLVTVQQFISELYTGFEPADFHLVIPKFKWKSIYTTNYDLIIERAYGISYKDNYQNLIPVYRASDRADGLPANVLPYVKLHGCITRCSEQDLSLILSPDQYVTHRKERETLFERLKSLGCESTILFVGHSLDDPDIRQILLEIGNITRSRPRYYALMLNSSDRQMRMWEGKRITLINGTFKDFLFSLQQKITNLEVAIAVQSKKHPIESKFVSNGISLTEDSLGVLDTSLIYIHSALPTEQSDPKRFYHGFSNDWYPIQNQLDVRRVISDDFISEVILMDESERSSKKAELYLVSGSAGSGKSVILKRISWDSAIEYNKICLYWNSVERINVPVILELAEKVGERIFFFVDRASKHISDLLWLYNAFAKAGLPITCIISERTNEWNTECSSLNRFLTDSFEVNYLTHKEIISLIDLLEKHNCLGVLKNREHKDRVNAFSQKAGRQLLVALHEVTMAKPFNDIIQDEYDNIAPRKAQLIYRTICIMNQYGIPVRAGVINRVHNVNFGDFQTSFLAPLENVVQVSISSGDHEYESRHPTIAEMVFNHSLSNQAERFNTYLELLTSLDVGYSSDRAAFRELIKYKNLTNTFNDHNSIMTIYSTIEGVCSRDDFYYQQLAIFYMRSQLADYSKAEEMLSLSENYGGHSNSIIHSRAELELLRASVSKGLERERLFNKAERLARNITGKNAESSHGYDTLCKISIQRLKDVISGEDEELISDAIKKANDAIENAIQAFPDDEILLSEEVRLAELLKDNERVLLALEKAFKANKLNGFLARSLSRIYESQNRLDEAKILLTKVLDAAPTDKASHALLAMHLVKFEPNQKENAEYHWKHSFTDGDMNFINQLWYARQLYINNKFEIYLRQIEKLKQYRVPPKTRHTVRGLLEDSEHSPIYIVGKIIRKEFSYALIKSMSYYGIHFLHKSNCDEVIWDMINIGDEIRYHLGFTFSGAAAVVPQQ